MAGMRGCTTTQVADKPCCFGVAKSTRDCPIIGFSSAEQIDDVLAARGKLLTEEEETYLEELYQPQEVLGHV